MENMRNHGGSEFKPGFPSLKEALTNLISASSIFAALAAVFLVVPFQSNSNPEPFLILFALLTFIIFLTAILTMSYFLLIRPLSGTAPTSENVYMSLRLLLLGLAFTLFTLAIFI